ncbi:MAG: hypothetical protein ACM3ZT_05245 [Bacillota bacterium]
MNRSSVALAVLAGLVSLMLAFGGVCFLGGAAYLAMASELRPWLAALVTGVLMLLPLLAMGSWLAWDARRRRLRRHRHLEALKATLAGDIRQHPYGVMGAAFMSGIMMAASPAVTRQIVDLVGAGIRSCSED